MNEQAEPWRGRRVLVTGITGLLGGAVTRELLACGAEVVGLVHHQPASGFAEASRSGQMQFVHGRADNLFRLHSAMAIHEVAAVFHLAACDTSALVQAVKLYSRRIPVVTARPIPQLSLARTDELHESRLTVVRFGEVFGPGDRKLTRVVSATSRALLSGEALAIAESAARDFVFIRDAAKACLLAATSSAGEYTFRSGWQLTDKQMAATIRDVSVSRIVEVPESAPLANPLGWQPSQSLAEALGETLAWYRASHTQSADGLRAAA